MSSTQPAKPRRGDRVRLTVAGLSAAAGATLHYIAHPSFARDRSVAMERQGDAWVAELTIPIGAQNLFFYPAAAVEELGVIHHVEGDRFPVGELDGSETERVKWVHDVLVSGGLKSRVLTDIRGEIWLKAWGNLTFNPISALSHATLVAICQFPETRALAADMMAEAQAVAEKLGVTFRHTIEKRIQGAESVGAHKTSMLQDVEFGRSLETEALVGSILEMAEITETPAPSIKAVYACVKLLNKVMLTEGAGVRVAKAE